MATSENTWPAWVGWLGESAEQFACTMVELVSMMFSTNSNSTNAIESTDNIAERLLYFVENAVGTLTFDHFQLQLLKIFILILISTIILICAAWHIYGQRISERFMHSGRNTRASSPCAVK